MGRHQALALPLAMVLVALAFTGAAPEADGRRAQLELDLDRCFHMHTLGDEKARRRTGPWGLGALRGLAGSAG